MRCGVERAACLQAPTRSVSQRRKAMRAAAAPACRLAPRAARRPSLRAAPRTRTSAHNGGNGSSNGGTGTVAPPSTADATSSGSPFTAAAAEASPALRGALPDGVMFRWLTELRSNGALVRQAVPMSDVGKVRAPPQPRAAAQRRAAARGALSATRATARTSLP